MFGPYAVRRTPYAVRGDVDLVLAVATSVPVAAGALVLYGLSTSTGNVTFSSLIQSRVPVHLLGGLLLLTAAAVGSHAAAAGPPVGPTDCVQPPRGHRSGRSSTTVAATVAQHLKPSTLYIRTAGRI